MYMALQPLGQPYLQCRTVLEVQEFGGYAGILLDYAVVQFFYAALP